MSERLTFPMRGRARVCLTIDPPIERVIGFRKDGSPRIEKLSRYVWPGQEFDIRDQKMFDQLFVSSFEQYADLLEPGEEEKDPYTGEPGERRTQKRRVLGEQSHEDA